VGYIQHSGSASCWAALGGLLDAKVPAEKERLQREINATDRQIDLLVYELYGLTDDDPSSPSATPRQESR